MKLGKWLAINRCIERVDRSSGKFVFRGAVNVLSESRSRTHRFVAPFDTVPVRETENRHTGNTGVEKASTGLEKSVAHSNSGEAKTTSDVKDPQLNFEVLHGENNVNARKIKDKQQTGSKIGRAVGRWAMRAQITMPKPSPIQTEFKFKSIEVVRNDLTCADIEIRVVRGAKNGGARKVIDFLRSVRKFAERIFGFIALKVRL